MILFLSVGFQIILQMGYDKEEEFDIIDILYITGLGFCIIFSFIVFKKFGRAKVFGIAYFLLGIGFVFYLTGDTIYIYFSEVIGEDPYPAILPDSFYLGFYPFVIAHIVINIRFFKEKFLLTDKFLLIGISALSIGVYFLSIVNIDIEFFDFNYGLIFVVFASIAFSFSVLGATIFRSSILGPIWLLLALGLSISTSADIWYYSSEAMGIYDNMHPVNTMYMASYLVIIYALYKHVKAF